MQADAVFSHITLGDVDVDATHIYTIGGEKHVIFHQGFS